MESPKVFAESGQVSTNDGDRTLVITAEEQNMRENKLVEGKVVTTVITAEEQNMVENSSDLEGFVQQENGTGFYFTREK